MWKMAGWLAKIVAAGLMISFLSIWTTGYIVNSYVETLLKQFNVPLETKPFALSGVWGNLWGAGGNEHASGADDKVGGDEGAVGGTAGNGGGESAVGGTANDGSSGSTDGGTAGNDGEDSADDGTASGAAGDGDASTDDGDASANGTGDGADTDDHGTASGDGDTPPVAIDAFQDEEQDPLTGIGGGSGPKANSGATPSSSPTPNGESAGTSGTDPKDTETAVSAEDLNDVKNEMSSEDKDRLFALLMTKLPQEAWQSISTYAENGLTKDELTNVQQIMAQHLNKEEYEQMMDILKKY
ncbi:hypothetical protein ACFO9Q_16095 [Paenibacillus sp. GCM10023252]|uniref:hypothetical protein n=1 Tax=Paenibacillus sp. GCM10023252 TaxID=3252649 RepID=UPI00361BDEF0